MSTGSTDSPTGLAVSVPRTVRPAGAADVPALAAVAAATFELACPPSMTRDRVEAFVDEVLSPERFADYVADPARHVLLAESDGDRAGLRHARRAASRPTTTSGPRSGSGRRSSCRRSTCCRRPTARARPRSSWPGPSSGRATTGAAGVWLGVNQQNERAQRFYGKSGFERVGTKRFLVGGVYEDDYVMERALDPPPLTPEPGRVRVRRR